MFGMGGVKTVIGLDVGSYAVKAVALQPNKDHLTLQGYAQMRIGDSDQALVVRQVIEQLGVKPRHLVSSVSGRSVIVRQVPTPKLVGDDLKQYIAKEAEKYIPFGTDEVVIDCQPMPDVHQDPDAANQEVLLVAVRRNFVEDHVHLLQSAGLHPSVVDVDVFALVNAFHVLGPAIASGGEAGEEEGEQAPVTGATALVDIGASKSWVAIVKDGRLLFQREIYLAGNEITDAISRTFNDPAEEIEEAKLDPGETLEALLDASMPALEDLANEIRLSFDYVEGQFDEEVERVVLSGASSQMPKLADSLANILDRSVQVFDPLSGVDLVPSKYDLHGLDANAPSLTVALGLACHELAEDIQGLGGLQVATWKTHRGDGRATIGAAGGPMAAAGAAPPPEPEPSPAAGVAVAPPTAPPPPAEPPPTANSPAPAPPAIDMPAPDDPIDLESLQASMPPPSEEVEPPAGEPVVAPPAEPMDGPEDIAPPPAFDLPESDEVPSDGGTGSYGGSRSSMLVVLDDDEGSTDEYRKGLEQQSEESEDDDLPPLPG